MSRGNSDTAMGLAEPMSEHPTELLRVPRRGGLVADWCVPKPPDGWTLARPGVIEAVDGTTRWIDARQGELANELASSVGRPPLDVLAEIAAMVVP